MPHRRHKLITPKINIWSSSANVIFLLLPSLWYSHRHPLTFGVSLVPSGFLTFSLSPMPSPLLLISKLFVSFFHCHGHSSSSLTWTLPITWARSTKACIIQWFVLLNHLSGHAVPVSPCQLSELLSFLHTYWTVHPLRSLPALSSAWNTLLFAFAYVSATLLHDLVLLPKRNFSWTPRLG